MRTVILALLALTPSASARAADTAEIDGTIKVVLAAVTSRTAGPQDVVIYLEDAPNVGAMPRGPFEMAQVGKEFTPGLLIVPQGATVKFPNGDLFFHNVFSVTPGSSFDLGMYKAGQAGSTRFDHPGVVTVYCNIHPQMIGHILVVSNPFFTSAGADGSFRLKGIPPGTYHVVAWFPFGQPTRQEIRVEAGQPTSAKLIVRERSDAGRHDRKDGSKYTDYGATPQP